EVFGTIANETNCAIELAHHTRKKATGQDEYTAADARGSSTIHDAVRGMRVTNQMSKSEAEEFGISELERTDYFRVTRGKANMVRGGAPRWYHFASVTLPNETEEKPADDVGVLEAWVAPKTGAALTDEDRAYFQALVTDDSTYREDIRARNWIGLAIARRLKLNLGTRLGKNRAKGAFRWLLDEGILAVRDGLDQDGQTRSFVVPGPVPAGGLGK